MKKLFLFLAILFISSPSFAVVEWSKGEPAGTRSVSDIDYYVTNNMSNLDVLLASSRTSVAITYNDNASVVVSAGQIMCSNSAGTVRRVRSNSASVTSTWSVADNGLDAGSEASSTTYYVYVDCDADAETFKIKLSTSSTAPTGLTYFKKLGSFYNDSSSNITQIINDNLRQYKEKQSKTIGATYQALTDGNVEARIYCSDTSTGQLLGYTDNSSSPSTQIDGDSCNVCSGCGTATYLYHGGVSFNVKAGDYYKVDKTDSYGSPTATMYFIPNN